MGKKQLILVPSAKMDRNKKEDRYEDKLIRLGAKARENLGLLDEKTVELWPTTSVNDRINRSKTLKIFRAFSEDLKILKDKEIDIDEYLRVGFVTTKTFEYICGNGADSSKDIWISQSIDDTVIGGDPEFILVAGDGYVQYAGHINDFGSNGQLASDGPLAEIRPDPAIKAEDFVNAIRKILTTHPRTKILSPYEWMATCCWLGKGLAWENHERNTWPVGGHIHVGTPIKVAEKCKSAIFQNAYYVVLCKILDELLGIPLMKLDNKDECRARRIQYGQYGSYRTDSGRLEYRTLSGMWMAHPKLALITFGVAKAIIDSFFSILEAKDFDLKYLIAGKDPVNTNFFDPRFTGWKDIGIANDMGATKSSSEMVAILNQYKITYSKAYASELHKIFKKLPAYKQYAEHLDTLVELVSLPYSQIKKIDRDMKHTWVANADFIL